MTSIQAGQDENNPVLTAIEARRSVRAFLPTPVPRDMVVRILQAASRAPSGANLQPWQVHVVTGAAKSRLSAALHEAAADSGYDRTQEYESYPRHWFEPYLARRRKVGWDLYGRLKIGRRDLEAIRRQHGRNYDFFDAPVGLFFTIDQRLERGSWLDCGMFIQNVMIAARGLGLHTCPQAAFITFHRVVRAQLSMPDQQTLLCGMALGYEDTTRPENALRTEREPVSGFTRFHAD